MLLHGFCSIDFQATRLAYNIHEPDCWRDAVMGANGTSVCHVMFQDNGDSIELCEDDLRGHGFTGAYKDNRIRIDGNGGSRGKGCNYFWDRG